MRAHSEHVTCTEYTLEEISTGISFGAFPCLNVYYCADNVKLEVKRGVKVFIDNNTF